MKNSREGSTAHLIELCVAYFFSYVGTGILVKVFTGGIREPRMSDMEYLVNNTVGSSLLCLLAVVLLGWLRSPPAPGAAPTFHRPSELGVIVPSGICTAIIIPGTTLLYTLPISVMVAMVIMRASVIIVSRIVDSVQIRQGLLKKKVLPEENWAVAFALLALATNLLLIPFAGFLESRGIEAKSVIGVSAGSLKGGFDFLHNPLAMTVLTMYIVSYAIRLYIMNWFKNARHGVSTLDNRGFFAWEQLTASVVMFSMLAFFYFAPPALGWTDHRFEIVHASVNKPDFAAFASGVPFALVAFFSVFLFMFHGRTATFAGVVNRLTSLLAGTTATVILALVWHTKPPAAQDWASLGFILVAVWFLTRAESKRAAELKRGT